MRAVAIIVSLMMAVSVAACTKEMPEYSKGGDGQSGNTSN